MLSNVTTRTLSRSSPRGAFRLTACFPKGYVLALLGQKDPGKAPFYPLGFQRWPFSMPTCPPGHRPHAPVDPHRGAPVPTGALTLSPGGLPLALRGALQLFPGGLSHGWPSVPTATLQLPPRPPTATPDRVPDHTSGPLFWTCSPAHARRDTRHWSPSEPLSLTARPSHRRRVPQHFHESRQGTDGKPDVLVCPCFLASAGFRGESEVRVPERWR